MKFRNGFVSNSSSSSFVIGFKNEISENKLLELFKTENKLLMGISKEIVSVIMNNASETSIAAILKDYYVNSIDELPTWYKKILNTASEKNFKIYTGYFEDGGNGVDGIEAYLCHTEIIYEDDNMLFYKENGY